MPGLSAVKLFTFNNAHVFGDVNETNVCKYNASAKLSECVSRNGKSNKINIRFQLMDLNKSMHHV